jgi:cell division protein FtsQ
MSAEYLYGDEELGMLDAVNDAPFQPAFSRKIEKGLKRLLIFAAFALAAGMLWLFVVSPCIPLSTVEVRGFPGFEGETVKRFAGIGEGASFISVNAAAAEKLLSGHYLVESAKVVKRFPDRLSIFLEKRRPVAVSLADINGRMTPLYYDREGVVFQIGGAHEGNLPVVSGLVFEKPVLGMRLPVSFIPLLAEIEKTAEQAPELLAAVSEIRISRTAYDGFDLLLYPVHGKTRVHLEHTLNADTLRYVLLMLDVFAASHEAPAEIDFRSGMGAYTVKEAPSGE